jgi:hypothetical protein
MDRSTVLINGGSGGERDDAHDRAEAWLNARGIATINVLYPDIPLKEVLGTVAACNPRGRPVFILGGQSCNGVNHSVVCCDGKIVCDPSQDDSGIVGPCDDGFYWLTFFGSLQATDSPARHRPRAAIERENLEIAAQDLKRVLKAYGAHADDLWIAIGCGELHAYAACHEVQWRFPKPLEIAGYPVEWHFGNVGMVSAREAAE